MNMLVIVNGYNYVFCVYNWLPYWVTTLRWQILFSSTTILRALVLIKMYLLMNSGTFRNVFFHSALFLTLVANSIVSKAPKSK